MIFGTLNSEKIWHENLTGLPTSPVTCSYYILRNLKKSFSAVLFTHTSDYLCYLRRQQTVIHLPTPPENVTTLNCKLQNFFIWLKVCCVFFKHWRLWKEPVVMYGNWNVRQTMPQQVFRVTTFCISTFFRSFSTLISRIVYHAMLKFSPCRNNPLLQASINLSISIHVHLL